MAVEGIEAIVKASGLTKSQVVIGSRSGAKGESYRGWLITREKVDDEWHYSGVEPGEVQTEESGEVQPEAAAGGEESGGEENSVPEKGTSTGVEESESGDGDEPDLGAAEAGTGADGHGVDAADLEKFPKAVARAMKALELDAERLFMLIEGRGPNAQVRALRELGKGIGQKTAEKTINILREEFGYDIEHGQEPEPNPELAIKCPNCGHDHGAMPPDEVAYSDSQCPECGQRFLAERAKDAPDQLVYTLASVEEPATKESDVVLPGASGEPEEPDPHPPEDPALLIPDSDGEADSDEVTIPDPVKSPNGLPYWSDPPECVVASKHPTHSDEWYAARAAGIGSSDAGAILGVSQFATIVDVWESKVDPDYDQREQPWLDEYRAFGTWFEPYIIAALEEEIGVEIIRGAEVGALKSLRNPILLANLDAWYQNIFEIKTSEKPWPALPESHYAQVQHQMLVTGATEVDIWQFISPLPRQLFTSLRAAFRSMKHFPFEDEGDDVMATWLLSQGELVRWPVQRDQDYIERMYARYEEFWECVVHGIEPEILPPEGTVDLSDRDELVRAFSTFAQVDQDTKDFRAITKRRNAHSKKVKNMIERELALDGTEAKYVTVGDHKATLVEKGKTTYWQLYPAKQREET